MVCCYQMSQNVEIVSNLGPNFFWLKVRTKGPRPSICVRTFSQFTSSPASSALGAAQATMTLTCSNIQRKIRALGLIPSNIQVNYQITTKFLVNTLRSGRIWPANVEHCPQFWTLGQTFLEKLLLIWLLSSMFCK